MTRSQITEGSPTIEDAIKSVVQDELQRGNGWLPVEIVKVNTVAGVVRSVDAAPLIRAVINGEPVALPTAFDVPIAWQASNGGTSAITFPLSEGDTGRIQPAGGDISAWMASGTKQASDMEQGSLDLSDSVFTPDIRPFVALLQAGAFSTTDIVLSGPVQVGSSAASAKVGLNNDPCPYASAMATWMTQVETFINGLVPLTVNPLSGTFGSTAIANLKATSTKLRSL